MSDINQRVAELIGDEPRVVYCVMGQLDGAPYNCGEFQSSDAANNYRVRLSSFSTQCKQQTLTVDEARRNKPYETDLNTAWEAAERFLAKGKPVAVRTRIIVDSIDGLITASVCGAKSDGIYLFSHQACGETPALAICNAIISAGERK